MSYLLPHELNESNIGNIFSTYYLTFTSNSNKVKECIKPIQIKLIKLDKSSVYSDNWECLTKPETFGLRDKINRYFNDLGHLYPNHKECVEWYDYELNESSKKLSIEDRERMLKFLVNKVEPNKSNLEIKSIEWFNSLPKRNQSYVKWLTKFYNFK